MLLISLGLLTTKWYQEKQPASKEALTESMEWSQTILRTRPTPKPAVRDTSECSFGHQKKAPSDVCTNDLLQMINDGKFPSGTGEEEEEPTVPMKKKGPLKIIVVPHSHNDPGWHKTVDNYFEDQSKHTLNNMVDKLLKYPKMTFVWAESVFLDLWWQDLDFEQRGAVRKLIENKQLEIVVGSWVVPDEANPHLFALIDQMIEGHQWLDKNLGVKPANTWSLDPFGYTSTLPYLYSKAGFSNMVILRVHQLVKSHLIDKKALEFFWRQHWDIQGVNDIRTQMMPYKLYNIKHTCGPDHHICLQFDFRQIPGEISEARPQTIINTNVERQAKLLLGQYTKKSKLFRHNVVLVPLGDDFRYDRSLEWDQQFKNYQQLFNYMNAKEEWNVQARFGTIQDYFDEVVKEGGDKLLPTLTGDFFPYTDERDEFWTGYFTTRPFDKMAGRQLESFLRGAEILNVMASAMASKTSSRFLHAFDNQALLKQAHQSLGLFQHHDAITGTARSYVAEDYRNRLLQGIEACQKSMKQSLHYLLASHMYEGSLEAPKPTIVIDIDDPSSLQSIKNTPKFVKVFDAGVEVALFNPQAKQRSYLARILVDFDTVEVYDINGHIVPSQMNPVWVEDTVMSANRFELVFYTSLQPTELRVFTLKRIAASRVLGNTGAQVRFYNSRDYIVPSNIRFQVSSPENMELLILENEAYRIRFSPRTGLMHSITTKAKIQTTKTNLEFLMYKSRGSGAYIFYPAGPAIDSEFSSRPLVRVIKGPLLEEIHVIQKFVEHRTIVHNTTGILSHAIEIKNFVNLKDTMDKELVMRFSTDIENTNETFYTDLNGFQMMKRKRYQHFSTPANYYPMSSMFYIEDGYSRFSILSAQPLGVSSLQKGWLEVMLDRRMMYDDGRGLGEGVMDNRRTPLSFYLLIERTNSKPLQSRSYPEVSHPSLLSHVLLDNLNRPAFTVFVLNRTVDIPKSLEFLGSTLPCDIELVNLRGLYPSINENNSKTEAALVLHRRAFDCDFPSANLHCTTNGGKVILESLFKDFKIKKAQETTLSLMHEKESVQVHKALNLHPMEIYTYKLEF